MTMASHTSPASMMKRNIGIILTILVLFALAGVAWAYTLHATCAWQERVDTLSQQETSLQSQLETLQNQHDAPTATTAGDDGLDSLANRTQVHALVHLACDWDSYHAYATARTRLHDEYAQAYDGPLLAGYMPDPGTVRLDDGTSINDIDNRGLNSSIVSVDVRFLDDGTWLALASIRSTDRDGNTASGLVAFTIPQNEDGSFGTIRAATITNQSID